MYLLLIINYLVHVVPNLFKNSLLMLSISIDIRTNLDCMSGSANGFGKRYCCSSSVHLLRSGVHHLTNKTATKPSDFLSGEPDLPLY